MRAQCQPKRQRRLVKGPWRGNGVGKSGRPRPFGTAGGACAAYSTAFSSRALGGFRRRSITSRSSWSSSSARPLARAARVDSDRRQSARSSPGMLGSAFAAAAAIGVHAQPARPAPIVSPQVNPDEHRRAADAVDVYAARLRSRHHAVSRVLPAPRIRQHRLELDAATVLKASR